MSSSHDVIKEVIKIKMPQPLPYRFCRHCRTPIETLFESARLQWGKKGWNSVQPLPWSPRHGYNYSDDDDDSASYW